MRKELKNERLGINETDIKNSSSVEDLTEWKLSLDMEKIEVEERIFKLSSDFYNGDNSNQKEYGKAKSFIKVIELLKRLITIRISELQNQLKSEKIKEKQKEKDRINKEYLLRVERQQQAKKERLESKDRLLIDIFREQLTEDQFRSGLDELSRRLNN